MARIPTWYSYLIINIERISLIITKLRNIFTLAFNLFFQEFVPKESFSASTHFGAKILLSSESLSERTWEILFKAIQTSSTRGQTTSLEEVPNLTVVVSSPFKVRSNAGCRTEKLWLLFGAILRFRTDTTLRWLLDRWWWIKRQIVRPSTVKTLRWVLLRWWIKWRIARLSTVHQWWDREAPMFLPLTSQPILNNNQWYENLHFNLVKIFFYKW